MLDFCLVGGLLCLHLDCGCLVRWWCCPTLLCLIHVCIGVGNVDLSVAVIDVSLLVVVDIYFGPC